MIYTALVDLMWNTNFTSEPPVLSVRPLTDSAGLNKHHHYAVITLLGATHTRVNS